MSGEESGESISASSGQKRSREEGDQPVPTITIFIQNQEGRETCYKVEPNTRLRKVFKNFCTQHNMEREIVSFIYKRNKLNSMETPAQLNMKEGATILASLKKDGGGFSG